MSDADEPRRIDYDTVSKRQLYRLAMHYSDLFDVVVNANNAMAGTLTLSHPDLAETLKPLLEEWSRFIAHAAERSDAEVGRILGQVAPADRRKMN